ncbi:MAG: SoxR reducing system RseC family protein [Bacteroidota bacterium]|nr:SoxR reducing system RseC family protein [Bacteroidota bacterium]
MNSENLQIEHEGIVKEISLDEIKVSIVTASFCASCELKQTCNPSELEEKIIDVPVTSSTSYRKGERVNIFYKQSLGFRALFLGYLLPFLIILISMIVLLEITGDEGIAGGISLALLLPYYLILYLVRKKIKKTFRFSVEKKNIYNNVKINPAF